MNKKLVAFVVVAFLVAVGFFGYLFGEGNTYSTRLEIENSNAYSEDDLQSALRTVEKNFRKEYRGCTLVDLWYNDDYNLKYRDAMTEKYHARESIILLSNIHTGKSGALDGQLKGDKNYSNYTWLLTRKNKKDHWQVVEAGHVFS